MTPFAVTRCWFRGRRSRSPSPCLGSSRGIIGSLADDSDIGRARTAKLPPLSSEPPLELLPARSPHCSLPSLTLHFSTAIQHTPPHRSHTTSNLLSSRSP